MLHTEYCRGNAARGQWPLTSFCGRSHGSLALRQVTEPSGAVPSGVPRLRDALQGREGAGCPGPEQGKLSVRHAWYCGDHPAG